MRKLLILFVVFLIACTTTKTIVNSNQSYEQLDSILKAEKVLTYDSLPLQDYETKEWFYEYFFIRDSLVIRWIPRGDSVQITKRIDK
jgi:hypothetical protein